MINTTTGQLGTIASSRRYKQDIRTMPDMRARLTKLRPVTFRYKKAYPNGSKPLQYGLIAEEVAEVLPRLAVFNKDGQPETVKYHLLPTLLLAAYQREHAIIQAQAEKIARQQAINRLQADRIAALERRLTALEARAARLAENARK